MRDVERAWVEYCEIVSADIGGDDYYSFRAGYNKGVRDTEARMAETKLNNEVDLPVGFWKGLKE